MHFIVSFWSSAVLFIKYVIVIIKIINIVVCSVCVSCTTACCCIGGLDGVFLLMTGRCRRRARTVS